MIYHAISEMHIHKVLDHITVNNSWVAMKLDRDRQNYLQFVSIPFGRYEDKYTMSYASNVNFPKMFNGPQL